MTRSARRPRTVFDALRVRRPRAVPHRPRRITGRQSRGGRSRGERYRVGGDGSRPVEDPADDPADPFDQRADDGVRGHDEIGRRPSRLRTRGASRLRGTALAAVPDVSGVGDRSDVSTVSAVSSESAVSPKFVVLLLSSASSRSRTLFLARLAPRTGSKARFSSVLPPRYLPYLCSLIRPFLPERCICSI